MTTPNPWWVLPACAAWAKFHEDNVKGTFYTIWFLTPDRRLNTIWFLTPDRRLNTIWLLTPDGRLNTIWFLTPDGRLVGEMRTNDPTISYRPLLLHLEPSLEYIERADKCRSDGSCTHFKVTTTSTSWRTLSPMSVEIVSQGEKVRQAEHWLMYI